MNDLLCQKLDELFLLLEKDPRLVRLQALALLAQEDEEIREMKKKLEAEEENRYSATYRENRIQFMSHPLVKEYLSLSKEVQFLLLEMNQSFRSLATEKGCTR